MKNNIVRLGILSVLIILCIGQTTLLWLGNMPSHNFLGHTSYEAVTEPKQIWVGRNGVVYKIAGNKENRLSLIAEVTNEIKKGNVKVEATNKSTYEELLSREGIIYEYGTPLSLDELVGSSIESKISKNEIGKIASMFIDVSEGDSYRTYVYLIDDEFKVIKKLTINNQLMLHMRTVKTYSEGDVIQDLMDYQASLLSINDSEYFQQNVFLPRIDQTKPITYHKLKLEPVVLGNTDVENRESLESYVNDLFKNPLYKQVSYTVDSIIFSDNLSLNVRYSEKGTLEFNKNLSNDVSKLSAAQKMNKINSFIAECQAIPNFLKQGVYLLSVIKQETGETVYRFGYRYNDFEMLLTQEVKNQLELNAFLELTIKGNQIIRGKWLMLQPELTNVQSNNSFTRGYLAALSDAHDNYQNKPFSNLECAYIIQDLNKPIEFDWVALYDDKWYYP